MLQQAGGHPQDAHSLSLGQPCPAVRASACLLQRHKAAGCAACAAGCPTSAICLEENGPTVSAEACTGCGVCAALCPTSVFTLPGDAEKKLVQSAAQVVGDTLGLCCMRHPDPAASSAQGAAVVRHARCLAALSPGEMLVLTQAGGRTLWLDDVHCLECPLAAAYVTLTAAVELTNALLQAGGRPPAVHLVSQAKALPHPSRRPVIDGVQPKISRRDLFSGWRKLKQTAEPAMDDNGVPAGRRRLVAALRLLPKLEQTILPLPTPAVRETSCSACGLCAAFCPTSALMFVSASDRFELRLNAAACIGCGLCVLACPEGAISITHITSGAVFTSSAGEVTVAGIPVPCTECGYAVAARADGVASRCHVCRQAAGRVAPLFDGAGLMADLVRRAARVSVE